MHEAAVVTASTANKPHVGILRRPGGAKPPEKGTHVGIVNASKASMRVFLLLVVLVRVAAADPMNAVIGDRGVPVDTTDETSRIRSHLSFVLHALREAHVDLGEARRARRAAALGELERYIARGVFPRRMNDAYGERRPRFIDDRGVHCAVADLVAASGAAELARTIKR